MTKFRSPQPELIVKPKNEVGAVTHVLGALFNFFYFCSNVLGLKFTWFHREWLDYYRNNKFVYIISSRRHAKSTWAQALTVWETLKSRKIFLVVMNSGTQTAEWMRLVLSMLEDSIETMGSGLRITYEMLQPEIGQKLDQESIGRIMVSNGSVIYGRSLTSKIRGYNADTIICDDLLDKKMNISFEEAEHIFRAVIMGVREDHTKVIYVGTILKEGDCLDKLHTGEIGTSEGKFKGDKYPAILDWDKKEVLWPDFRHWNYLMDQKALVGEMDFQIEYMLDPLADQLALISRTMAYGARDFDLVLGREPHPDSSVVIGVDLQISPSKDADWSVFLALEILDTEWRILDMERIQADEDTQLMILDGMAKKYDAYEVRIETNGFQRLFANLFKKKANSFTLNIETHDTRGEKHDKQIGVPSLRTLFTNQVIVIPWGIEYKEDGEEIKDGSETKAKMGILIQELTGWQYDKHKNKFISKRRHDDTTMAFWFAVLSARSFIDEDYEIMDSW